MTTMIKRPMTTYWHAFPDLLWTCKQWRYYCLYAGSWEGGTN